MWAWINEQKLEGDECIRKSLKDFKVFIRRNLMISEVPGKDLKEGEKKMVLTWEKNEPLIEEC